MVRAADSPVFKDQLFLLSDNHQPSNPQMLPHVPPREVRLQQNDPPQVPCPLPTPVSELRMRDIGTTFLIKGSGKEGGLGCAAS